MTKLVPILSQKLAQQFLFFLFLACNAGNLSQEPHGQNPAPLEGTNPSPVLLEYLRLFRAVVLNLWVATPTP